MSTAQSLQDISKNLLQLLATIALIAIVFYAGSLYVGYFLLGLSTLATVMLFWSLLTCKSGGCVSGLMLLPVILLAIVGTVLIAIGMS